ncbi:MAG: VacJ family lipoprotein, partial [Psychromonas sp.]|nr:VacJ family lipoprotein [Psychromonas sp.]
MLNLPSLCKYNYCLLTGVFLFFLVLFSHCSSAQIAADDPQYQMSDPIEPVNRLMWDFNYKILDSYIYRPVTQTYVDWVPKRGRKALNNFVLNFNEPSTMVNYLIQLDIKHAAQAFFRFSVNSTFGLLGFLDVAERVGVPRRRETFSNVLGRWSVPNGPYLMLPVIGPRSTRKLVGNFVDGLYFPFSYLSFEQEAGLEVLDGLDKRESLLGQERLVEQSLDPYSFVKG